MSRIDYSAFALEGFKITLFCLGIIGLLKLFGAANESLLIPLIWQSCLHLLGDYHNVVALDRIILTCIGGLIVITVTLMLYWIKPSI